VNEVSVLVGFGAGSLRNWPPMFRDNVPVSFLKVILHISTLEDDVTTCIKRTSSTLPSDAAFFIIRRRYLKETKDAEFL
jgi:hypothetical protein